MEPINKDILIEDLVQILPASVAYMMDKGIRCLRCGEPMWGTLERACLDKGYSEQDIAGFVNDLNVLSGAVAG